MSATLAPFGLRPAFHPTGLDRAQALANGITSGYSSNILKGQPVSYSANNGVIQPVTSTEAFSGAFDGVEWTDTTGRRRVSNYWPASTSATSIIAYFYNDQQIVYEIQESWEYVNQKIFLPLIKVLLKFIFFIFIFRLIKYYYAHYPNEKE